MSHVAFINGNETNIYKYMKTNTNNKFNIPCCKYNNKLIAVQGLKNKWHYRHIIPCVLCNPLCTLYKKNILDNLFVHQRGPGSGKTWNIINMIQRSEFLHYTKFIYVSKQHSARSIIKDEFMSQYNAGLLNITNFNFKDLGKKYIIEYTNSNQIYCSIIISTIDAFMYSIGDKTVQTYDLFEGIVQSIVDNIKIDETIRFANMDTNLSETLYIIDETQDLKELYAKALIKIMKDTNMSAYIVGDHLQSISNEQNAFTYLLKGNVDVNMNIKKYIETPINICRRFSHKQLISFVNYMIPYKKYNLLPITAYDDNKLTDNALTILFQKNMNEQIEEIMAYYSVEVEKNNYLPEDFLIITPFITSNPLINALNMSINEFWIDKLGPNEYYNYSVIHKSEIGSSINLDESIKSTRIVSIHSSKGDGRNCVFVIGLYEQSLKTFSGLKDSLIYDSLLHVAITRMKKKLYILCSENDEIGYRIKNFLFQNDLPCSSSVLNINTTIKIKNILPMCGEKISLLFKENKTFIPDTVNGNYNVRQFIFMQQILFGLKDQQFDRMSHIKVINEIALNSPIVICSSWKEYNIRLKMINGTQENEYKDKMRCIPLLKIKNNIDIIHNIELIKNMNNLNNLSPLQMIIFYYITQITSKGMYTNMTILELYKIVHILDEKDTFNDYLLEHDDKMIDANIIVKKLITKFPKTSWNPNCSVEYNGLFTLKTNIDLIGYNKDTVILCYIVPCVNNLNYNEIKIKSMIDSYIISKSGNIKYDKKKIIVSVLSLNELLYIEYDEYNKLKPILKDTLFNYFSLKNKEVFNYYKEYGIIKTNVKYIDDINYDNINNEFMEILNDSLNISLDNYL